MLRDVLRAEHEADPVAIAEVVIGFDAPNVKVFDTDVTEREVRRNAPARWIRDQRQDVLRHRAEARAGNSVARKRRTSHHSVDGCRGGWIVDQLRAKFAEITLFHKACRYRANSGTKRVRLAIPIAGHVKERFVAAVVDLGNPHRTAEIEAVLVLSNLGFRGISWIAFREPALAVDGPTGSIELVVADEVEPGTVEVVVTGLGDEHLDSPGSLAILSREIAIDQLELSVELDRADAAIGGEGHATTFGIRMRGTVDEYFLATARTTVDAGILRTIVHAGHVGNEVFRISKTARDKQRCVLHEFRLKGGAGVAGGGLQHRRFIANFNRLRNVADFQTEIHAGAGGRHNN